MANQLEITLVRSTIGTVPNHQKTVKALGLKKLNRSRIVENTPQIRGMIKSIEYMLRVREISE